jgi:VWFA-related protein
MPGMTRKVSICVLLLAAVLTARGQSPPQVLLPLVVAAHHGDLVSDLTAESLTLSDNKAVVSGLRVLRGADLPLRLGILLDTSNSQRNNDLYQAAVKGVKDFVSDALRGDQDRVFFELFSTTVEATPLLTKAQVSGVSLPLQVGGATVLYDAIALACTDSRIGKSDWQSPVRRVLVIFSDGDDNQSHITRAKAESLPVSSGVVVFAISTNSSGRQSKGDSVLEKVSKATGGVAYTGVSPRSLLKIFAQVRKQIEAIYFVTYVPPGNPAKDEVHSVDVKPATGVKLEIRAPKLYAWNP